MESVGFVGAYLHGSLAAGGWFPPKSDVDLLVVVERALDPVARERLALTCVDVAAARPTLGMLELTVVRAAAAGAGHFPMPLEFRFREEDVASILAGTADCTEPAAELELAVHVRALREAGVSLAGPAVEDVFAPVPQACFLQAVEEDVSWILADEHILDTPVYGVLNLCRALWVVRRPGDRSTPGKAEAGHWAVEILPAHHRRLVLDTLDAHRDSRWVAPEHRRTAGRVWDAGALLSFRDDMRRRWMGGEATIRPRLELRRHPEPGRE